jgi:hypothetical protein
MIAYARSYRIHIWRRICRPPCNRADEFLPRRRDNFQLALLLKYENLNPPGEALKLIGPEVRQLCAGNRHLREFTGRSCVVTLKLLQLSLGHRVAELAEAWWRGHLK